MASPTSSPLMRFTAGAGGRGAGVGEGGREAAGPVEVGGRVADGAPLDAGALVAGRGAPGAAAGAPGAAPLGVAGAGAGAAAVGTEGSLIVGAADGFGGRLMRTVSFLGWTFDGSGGFGGTEPPGTLGVLSAITVKRLAKLGLPRWSVKLLLFAGGSARP
jgi:hypothetical protein